MHKQNSAAACLSRSNDCEGGTSSSAQMQCMLQRGAFTGPLLIGRRIAWLRFCCSEPLICAIARRLTTCRKLAARLQQWIDLTKRREIMRPYGSALGRTRHYRAVNKRTSPVSGCHRCGHATLHAAWCMLHAVCCTLHDREVRSQPGALHAAATACPWRTPARRLAVFRINPT